MSGGPGILCSQRASKRWRRQFDSLKRKRQRVREARARSVQFMKEGQRLLRGMERSLSRESVAEWETFCYDHPLVARRLTKKIIR